ncbi:hypothetical protein [Paenibacillus pedocola]|nr:hypothetical protein [Paenibacillus typhae]
MSRIFSKSFPDGDGFDVLSVNDEEQDQFTIGFHNKPVLFMAT